MCIASSLEFPQKSGSALKFIQVCGLSGWPNILQRNFSSKCIHGTPARFPFGNPGIGDDILMAMQQAAHSGRHSILR